MGPRAEPCGTPEATSAVGDSPIVKEKILFFKYNLNELKAEPRIPTHCLSPSVTLVLLVLTEVSKE